MITRITNMPGKTTDPADRDQATRTRNEPPEQNGGDARVADVEAESLTVTAS